MQDSVLTQVIRLYPNPEKLKIRDLSGVGALVDSLIEKGPDFLQVIADFDFTLSKFRLSDGRPGQSCLGVMTFSPLMSEDFRSKSLQLFNHYNPIEIDHLMTTEEKIPHMIEWYDKRRDITVAAEITKTDIKSMVAISDVTLRDGAKQAMSSLNDSGVPLLIFSAGNGDILEECLKRDDASFKNQKIVSNFMKYDDDERVVGYSNSTLIHVFNKNAEAVKDSGYFDDLTHRGNALVLGDSIGDLTMNNGMKNPGTILKIGFLNNKIDERLDSFLQSYDVVLLDDQTFDFVNLLLEFILKKNTMKSLP